MSGVARGEVNTVNDTSLTVLTEEESAQAQMAIKQYPTEIDAIRERMRRDQEEIAASGARTDEILQSIQARLTQLRTS